MIAQTFEFLVDAAAAAAAVDIMMAMMLQIPERMVAHT